MTILGRIRLPQTEETIELYVRSSGQLTLQTETGDRAIDLSQGEHLSCDTYFNSLYETYYINYTTLTKIYYYLNLEGNFTLSLYREYASSRDRQFLGCQTLMCCQPSSPVKINIPSFATQTPGRIYFVLTCLSDRGVFKESWIATDATPNQSVHLGIISCTYKKEAYITKTVNTILQDSLLREKSFNIFVIDNGKTLPQDTFQDERVQITPNRNLGGSGGFTRGLIEANQQNHLTHFLMMDDDVELDSEVIYRLILLYEYAKSDFAVSGSMLDLCKKHLLFEAGANYAKSLFRAGFEPFELLSLKTDLDLKHSKSLNTLLIEEPIDYGAFWFFAFPKRFIQEIGYPLPFFIKGDDIEFGLRISQKYQQKIITFPSISVWHEPFYLKFPVWDSYYYFRNCLTIHAIHGSLSYFKAVKDISTRLIYMLLFFDYNSASMLIKAFEDYIKGPEFLKHCDAEIYHSNIIQLSKTYSNQCIIHTFEFSETPDVSRASLLRKIASLLTLNGHFLPNFLIQEKPKLIWYAPGFPGQRSRALARKKILLFKEKMGCVYQYEMNRKSGFKILQDWIKVAWQGWFRWSMVNSAWKKAAPEFSSLSFWKKYLHLS